MKSSFMQLAFMVTRLLTKQRIGAAKRTGENLGADAYGYSRAFQYTPDAKERTILSLRLAEKLPACCA